MCLVIIILQNLIISKYLLTKIYKENIVKVKCIRIYFLMNRLINFESFVFYLTVLWVVAVYFASFLQRSISQKLLCKADFVCTSKYIHFSITLSSFYGIYHRVVLHSSAFRVI